MIKSPIISAGSDAELITPSALDQDESSYTGKLLYAANGELTLRVLRVQYRHSKKSATFVQPFGFLVEVQGGTLEILMDLLLHDVKKYSTDITDNNRFPIRFWDNQTPILTLNHYNAYRQAFLSNYRCFCTGEDLIAYLQHSLQKLDQESWDESVTILTRIIDICNVWIDYYLEDFLDSLSLRESISSLLGLVLKKLRKCRLTYQPSESG